MTPADKVIKMFESTDRGTHGIELNLRFCSINSADAKTVCHSLQGESITAEASAARRLRRRWPRWTPRLPRIVGRSRQRAC